MKIRAIRLQNVRRFTEPVEIAGIGDGLNVLCAPNERGKSTVFDAIHALFFKDRKSWDAEMRALAPLAGGDPQVTVEIEVDGQTFRIEKRWRKSRQGEVRIWSNGQLIRQADEAEEWIAAQVRAPKEGGPAGLLWVRQGLTSLGDDRDARVARRDLMTLVSEKVEDVTGGKRMEEALRRCGEELAVFLTATGRTRADGPLDREERLVAALSARQALLAGTAARLRAELEERRSARRELQALDAPEEEAARQARLAEARSRLDEAERHAERLSRANEAERAAVASEEAARERLERLERQLAEAATAEVAHEAAAAAAAAAAARLDLARAARDTTEAARSAAQARAQAAAEVLRRAERARMAAAAAERRAELTLRLADAEKHRTEAEDAAGAAAAGLSTHDLGEIERLDAEARMQARALEAAAASVSVDYEPGREGMVSADGRPLAGGERTPIAAVTRLDVAGVGRLTLHPGAGSDGAAAERARAALRKALTKAGLADVAAARASAAARRDAEDRLRSARALFSALAPDGTEAIRAALAALPAPDPLLPEPPDADAARAEDEEARQGLLLADAALERARSDHGAAEVGAAGAASSAQAASARFARATADLADCDRESEVAARRAALDAAREAAASATRTRAALAAAAPELDAARAAFLRAQSVADRAAADRQRLRERLIELDRDIAHHAGDAVEEELADVETRLAEAQRALAATRFEVDVLKRLEAALVSARNEARDRYIEPVKQALVPLLRLLWEGSELRFDADEVLPTTLVRAGREEAFDTLSGGTQEQIALLVRLAFARMLAQAGRPAPVILDDAIVYTDDDRIERIFDALTRQAQDLQILVFSCRQKAFRDLGGHSLTIAPVAETVLEGRVTGAAG